MKTEDPAFSIDAIGPVDVVLLSHDQHADNLDPAGRELVAGSPLTLTSADAATAARLLDARWVVPLHVRGWAHFSQGPDDVHAAFADANLTDRLRIIDPGEIATF